MTDAEIEARFEQLKDQLNRTATRQEHGEHEVMLAKLSREVADLKHESRDHRDRDVKIMGILRVMSEALETNNKATATMKKQINKLFALTKKELNRERRSAAVSKT